MQHESKINLSSSAPWILKPDEVDAFCLESPKTSSITSSSLFCCMSAYLLMIWSRLSHSASASSKFNVRCLISGLKLYLEIILIILRIEMKFTTSFFAKNRNNLLDSYQSSTGNASKIPPSRWCITKYMDESSIPPTLTPVNFFVFLSFFFLPSFSSTKSETDSFQFWASMSNFFIWKFIKFQETD